MKRESKQDRVQQKPKSEGTGRKSEMETQQEQMREQKDTVSIGFETNQENTQQGSKQQTLSIANKQKQRIIKPRRFGERSTPS